MATALAVMAAAVVPQQQATYEYPLVPEGQGSALNEAQLRILEAHNITLNTSNLTNATMLNETANGTNATEEWTPPPPQVAVPLSDDNITQMVSTPLEQFANGSHFRWEIHSEAEMDSAAKRLLPPRQEQEKQLNFSGFRPICQASLDGKCMRGPKELPGDFYCSDSRKPKNNGAFKSYIDLGLTYEIARQLKGMSVIEFGAGDGCYTGALHDLGQPRIEGFDSQLDIEARTEGLIKFADPTTHGVTTEVGGAKVGCADYILSLEMPQHVPTKFESEFLDNLKRHSSRGLIISWPNSARVHITDQQGKEFDIDRQPIGVNFMLEKDVISKIEALGYSHNQTLTKKLRDSSVSIPWLADSVFHFQKLHPTNFCAGIIH